MRISRIARGAPRCLCLIAVLAMGCGADASSPPAENENVREITAGMDAGHDSEAQHNTATDRDSGTQTSLTPRDSGEHVSDPGDADATEPVADSGASSCDVDCSTPDTVAPELLETWYFGWEGGNLSFFQISLCDANVAAYLFARGPNDTDVVRETGSYIVHAPDRVTADFMGVQPQSGAPLHFELEYDPTLDRLHRITSEFDGYSEHGERFSTFAWSEPAATCPTM